jgi:colanic acid biosynthesis glycosyl transferase WcaI
LRSKMKQWSEEIFAMSSLAFLKNAERSVADKAWHSANDSADSTVPKSRLGDYPGPRQGELNVTPTKILIHGINYAPELIGVGRYTRDLAEYLATQGHSVEVITAPPHYPGWWVRPPYRSYAYAQEKLNGVTVRRCPLFLHRSGKGIWRLLIPLSFALAATPVVVWRIIRSRPDVVLCIEPTLFSAPAAALAAKIVGARRILHVHDLEVDAAFAVGHLSGGLFKRMALSVERIILHRFKRIVTISDRMRDRLLEKRQLADRVMVIRNWVDLSRIKLVTGPNSFRNEIGLSESDFIVLYAGQIGAKQSLHLVFEAAEQLAAVNGLHFVIAGDGPLKARFVDRYGNMPNVHFLPLQPEERLCELLNIANLHILPQDGAAADLVLPSKLGGMLASRRPILIQAEEGTELYRLLKGVVKIVPPGDVGSLVGGIMEAQTGDHDISGYEAAAAHFARDQLLPRFLEILTAERASGRAAPLPTQDADYEGEALGLAFEPHQLIASK